MLRSLGIASVACLIALAGCGDDQDSPADAPLEVAGEGEGEEALNVPPHAAVGEGEGEGEGEEALNVPPHGEEALDVPPHGAEGEGEGEGEGESDGAPPEAGCAIHEDCLGWRACVGGECVDPGASTLAGRIVFNEVLIDGRIGEDANGDGDVDGTDDEFVELVNASDAPVDLGGFLLVEADLAAAARHTFAAGTTLPAGEALVVFGGGTASDGLLELTGAQFLTANPADPAFSFGLNLDDGGDDMRLIEPDRQVVARFVYGDECPPADGACPGATADRSVTRSPDITGDWVAHDDAEADVLLSPGTRTDGSLFGGAQ